MDRQHVAYWPCCTCWHIGDVLQSVCTGWCCRRVSWQPSNLAAIQPDGESFSQTVRQLALHGDTCRWCFLFLHFHASRSAWQAVKFNSVVWGNKLLQFVVNLLALEAKQKKKKKKKTEEKTECVMCKNIITLSLLRWQFYDVRLLWRKSCTRIRNVHCCGTGWRQGRCCLLLPGVLRCLKTLQCVCVQQNSCNLLCLLFI